MIDAVAVVAADAATVADVDGDVAAAAARAAGAGDPRNSAAPPSHCLRPLRNPPR